MRIEALENIKSHGYTLSAEDIVTVDDEAGAFFCASGWAKDTSGVVPTGERVVLNAALKVNPLNLAVGSVTVEG